MLVYLAIVGLLSGVNASPACFDRVDPRTAVSDCPYRVALCTNPMYWRVMWEQCPLTCGRCPGALPDPGKCSDRVHPVWGVPDCPSRAALCNDPTYQEMMWEQCPLTCNVCPGILPN